MDRVGRNLGVYKTQYSLKKLQEELGSRTTLQHSLDMPFSSVSPYLTFDLKIYGSRAISPDISSDLLFCFSHGFLRSLGTRDIAAKGKQDLDT